MNKSVESNSILEGAVWKALLMFFFPIMLGTFFQQLYNTVDAIIVGQFIGKQALAAAGGGSTVFSSLIVGFFVGVSSGATIVISQYFGAGRMSSVSAAIHTAILVTLYAGVILSVAGFFLAPVGMRMIDTPDDIFDDAVKYLRIFFVGILPMFVYNVGAGILRALGNSKTPFFILLIGCLVNVVMDLFFVAVLKFGIAGAAWATVISQCVCVIIVLFCLLRLPKEYRLTLKKLSIYKPCLIRIIRIGLPSGFQSTLYTISNLVIQTNINSFKTDVVAGWAVYMRIDGFFWLTVSSFGVAVTTFVGQNYGARKKDRIYRGSKEGLLMAAGTALLFTALLNLLGKYIFMLFTKDMTVVENGLYILRFLSVFYVTYTPVEILSGTIRGCGETLRPMLITMIGVCLLRVVWLLTVAHFYHTVRVVLSAYPVTWICASTVFFIYFFKGKWMHLKN